MKTLKAFATLAVLVSFALAVCSAYGQNAMLSAPSKQKVAVTASSATNDLEYTIGPDDVLSVNVWKEPELSVSVPVRPDGKISLPLLNDIQAAGLTPMELTNAIRTKLQKFVADPRVAVTVTAANSQRVYILGEVTRPGVFALTPNMTVLQALSTAGGFGQYADAKKIYVLRSENGRQTKLPFNYKEVVKGNNQQQNVLLRPGDTVVVP